MTGEGSVLVVEDSRLFRTVVTDQLVAHGYEVCEAEDGLAALELLAEWIPDVILCDIEMPRMGGLELLDAVRARPELAAVPVVFLTGHDTPQAAAEGLRRGAHDYLRKPFETIELLARVQGAVKLKRLQDELRERNADLERLSSTDALTGLWNRRAMGIGLDRHVALTERSGQPLVVLMIDVDRFKGVNDAHGHAGGDVILVEIARRLQAHLRGGDIVGRWGGEEFVVLAPDTDADGAAILGERLRAAVASEPVAYLDEAVAVTVSVGWAAAQDGPTTVADLIDHADRALYDAKAAGRDRVHGGRVPARPASAG